MLAHFECITRFSSLSKENQSYLLQLTEFSMCQNFWDYL